MFDAAPPEPELFHVLIQQCPLRSDLIDCSVETGCTLAELGADDRDVLAWVNGERELNLDYRPQVGEVVMLRQTVAGSDNTKAALAIVASVALAVYTGGLAAGTISIFGFSGTGAAIAVGLTGTLAINAAFIRPPNQSLDLGSGGTSGNRTTGNSNRAVLYGAVPRTYGTDTIFPPLGALSYTETQGEAQYLVMRFCLGYGPLQKDAANIRIGSTLLSDFASDTEFELFNGTTGSARAIPIYARNTVEQGLAISVNANGEVAVRSTVASTREISLDFIAPAMIHVNDEGKRRTCAVAIKIEYKLSSGSTWTTVSSVGDFQTNGAAVYPPENFTTHFPWTTAGTPGTRTGLVKDSTTLPVGGPFPANAGPALFIIGRDSKPFRAGIRIKTPSAASYDVRVTRVAGYIFSSDNFFPIDDPDEQATTKVLWTAIRSIGPVSNSTLVAGLEYMDLRIRITDQLGGTVDRLNLPVSSILPTWNGSAWVNVVTSNPAFVYRDMLIGSANSEPVDVASADDMTFKAWATENAAAGRNFNGTFDRPITVFDALSAAASIGRASYQIRDTLFSVVRDRPGISRSQIFSQRNAWGYRANKTFLDQPHAVKTRFRDAAAGYPDEGVERIVYADGYSLAGGGGTAVATLFEELSLFGVTDRDQAWRETRYHMAQAKLRPETHIWWAGAENVISQRGDVVGIAFPQSLLSYGAARIKSISGSTINTDETFTLPSGSKEVVFRKGTAVVVSASTTSSGTTNALVIGGGVPSGVAAGDLVVVGAPLDVLIISIEYNDELEALITAVPYSSPAVHNADSGTIPAFDPGITLPVEAPPAPVIISASPRYARTDGGQRIPRIAIVYRIPLSAVPVALARGAYRDDDDTEFEVLDERVASGVYTIDVPSADSLYVARIGLVSDRGVPGPFAEILVDFRFEVVGDLTTIGAYEITDTPDTRNDRFSQIVITVLPPTDLTNFRDVLVQIRKVGRMGWTDVGYTDQFNQQYYTARANGQAFEVRGLAVSVTGWIALDGPRAFITVTNATGDPNEADNGLTGFVELNVPNLRLRGQNATVNTFSGQDLRLQWDAPVTPPAGHKILDYRVRLRDPATGKLLHQSRELRKRFDYSIEQNELDSLANLDLSSPIRAINVEVIARSDRGGRSQLAATKSASNPAPLIPADLSVKGLKTAIRVRFNRPADDDYARTVVYASQSNGFAPGPGNQEYDGRDTKPIFLPDLAPGTWYVLVELYDRFGVGMRSTQISVVVGGDPAADIQPPSLPPAPTLSRTIIRAGQVTTASMQVNWPGSTDPEGNPVRYNIQYWTDPNFKSRVMHEHEGAAGATAQTTTLPNVTVGETYFVRVLAADVADNRSGYGPTSLPFLVLDDTTAPANITNFVANPKNGRFKLRWKLPADQDLAYVEIHRGTSATFTPDLTDASPTRVYVGVGRQENDDGVTVAGGPYWYKARTVDRAGNTLLNPGGVPGFTLTLGPVSITTEELVPDVQPPPKPLGLVMTSTVEVPGQFPPDVTMRVRWNQSVDPEGAQVYYNVQVWPAADDTRVRSFNRIKDSGAAQTSLVLPGVGPGRGYVSRVEAIDEAGNSLGYTANATHTTVGADTTPPPAPTFVTAVFNDAGNLVIAWTNPVNTTAANNFRDVEVSIYADAGFATLRYQKFDASQRVHWTAAENIAASGGTGDPTLFVQLRSRGTNDQFSAAVVPATQPVKAKPATVSGLAHSWSGDTGAADAPLVVTWNTASGADFYQLSIGGLSREVFGTRLVYTLGQNRSEHAGTAAPSLSLSVVGVDALGQVSAVAAATTATNAPPAAPSSVVLTGFFSSIGIGVNGVPPADLFRYRYRLIQTNPPAADVSFEDPSNATTREISTAASYQVGVKVVDQFGQASSETLSNTAAVDALTLADLRAAASYSDSQGNVAGVLAQMSDNDLSINGVSYPLAATWTRSILQQRQLLDRYRTITLSMAPASGATTTTNWYLRLSKDRVSWRYYAGPPVAGLLQEVADAAAAQTVGKYIDSAILGKSTNSRVQLQDVVEARFVELFIRNTGAATTVYEFYARRLVESDDLDADSVRALHIGAGQIDATHINAKTLTGVTIQTATGGARVELSTFNGVRTINSVGTVTAQQRIDGSGYVGGYLGGSPVSTIPTIAWDALGNVSLNGDITLGALGTLRTSGGVARVEFGASGIYVRNASNVRTMQTLTTGAGFVGLSPGSIQWDAAGALTFDQPITLRSDILFANTANLYRGKVNFGSPIGGFWLGNENQIPKMHVGSGNGTTGQYLQFDGNVGQVLGQGTFRTKGANNVKRVVMDFASDALNFYDDNALAASFDITSSAGSESYITGGLVHSGTLVGSTTQQGRIGGRFYSGANAALAAWSVNGVGTYSTGGTIGVVGQYLVAGTGNGVGGNVALNGRCGMVATANNLASNSVGLAAYGNYAIVTQQNNRAIGGALLLKGNGSPPASSTDEPTHTAECGSFVERYPTAGADVGLAVTWKEVAGGLHGTGNDWRKVTMTAT